MSDNWDDFKKADDDNWDDFKKAEETPVVASSVPQEKPGWFEPGSQSGAFARNLINGATVGTAPLMNALITNAQGPGTYGFNPVHSTTTNADDFKKSLSEYENADKQAFDQYPKTSFAGSVIGGLPAAIVTGGKSLAANMGVGGAMGAISGAGHYDPNESVGTNAGNIATESALGALIPVPIHGISKVVTPIARSAFNLIKGSRPASEQEMARVIEQFKNSSDVPQPTVTNTPTMPSDVRGLPDKFQILSDLYKRLNPTKYPEKAYPFDPDFPGNAGKTEQQYNEELQQAINNKIASDPYGQQPSLVDKNDKHFLNDMSSTRYTGTSSGQEAGVDAMTRQMNGLSTAGRIQQAISELNGAKNTHPFIQEDIMPKIFPNKVANNAGTLTNDETKNVIEHYNVNNPQSSDLFNRMKTGAIGGGAVGAIAPHVLSMIPGMGDLAGTLAPLVGGAGLGAIRGALNDAHLPLRAELPQVAKNFANTMDTTVQGLKSPLNQISHIESPQIFGNLRDYLFNDLPSDNPDVEAKKQEMLNHLDQNGDDETQQRRAQMLGQTTAAGRAVTNSDSPLHKR